MVAAEVELSLEEGRSLRIAAGKSRFRIHGLPPADFPTLPAVEGQARLELPLAAFRRLIGKVLFAVSNEESRFQLSGALLRLKGKRAEMVATDGHRLALIDTALPTAAGDDAVLVPRKALHELLRFEGEGNLEFRRGEHHLSFRCGAREMICRILDGAFPDYERVIARGNDKRVVVDRKALSEAVQRVALMTGDRNRGVRIEFTAGEIAIAAANPDLGEASRDARLRLRGAGGQDRPQPRLHGAVPGRGRDRPGPARAQGREQPVRRPPGARRGPRAAAGPDEKYLCIIMPMRI